MNKDSFMESQENPNAAPSALRCSAAAGSDGMYRYTWTTRFGRHSMFFRVKDGLIQCNVNNQTSPVRMFEAKPIGGFIQARLMKDWRFTDDSLHQITQDKSQ
jgi:hypothetical protein